MNIHDDMKISKEDLLMFLLKLVSMGWMQILRMFFGPSQVSHAVVCVQEYRSVGDGKCI